MLYYSAEGRRCFCSTITVIGQPRSISERLFRPYRFRPTAPRWPPGRKTVPSSFAIPLETSARFTNAALKSLAVYAVEFLPNNSGVIIGGEFGWTHWKPEGGGWKQLNQTVQPVTSLAALSERTVAFGIGDRQKPPAKVEIWDISANRKLQPSFQEPNGVRAVAACPAKKLIAWVTLRRKASIVDITSASKPTDFPQQYDCRAIALSADGKSMAVALDYYG